MNKQDWVIIWLSIQLGLASLGWLKAEKLASFLEGQQKVYADLSAYEDGTPFDCSKQSCGKKGK